MDTLIYFILVPMVYMAFAVFFIGTAVRLVKIFREPKHPTTLQVYPEKKPEVVVGPSRHIFISHRTAAQAAAMGFFNAFSHLSFAPHHRAYRTVR